LEVVKLDYEALKKNSKLNFRLTVFLLLPIIAAVCGMLWNTSKMLDAIAENVNKQEDTRSWQAAHSAIYSVQKRLEGLVADNAHWDDAVANTYGQFKEDWVSATWGVPTGDKIYDAMFIVDQNGETLTGYRYGKKITISAEAYFGQSFKNFIVKPKVKGSPYEAIGSLVKTEYGIAMVAAGPILPYYGDSGFKRKDYLTFILVKDIKVADARELGAAFILDNFAVATLETNVKDGRIITDRWGKLVAQVSWRPTNPGKAARDASLLASLVGIIALLVVMCPMAYVHLGTLRKMQLSESEAHISARHDSLTGIPNRVHLIEVANQKIPFADDSDNELALAFIDLDWFKAVNDSYGHEIGDTLITLVAKSFVRIAKDSAEVVRLGGDEFALLVCGKDAMETAKRLANVVLDYLRTPIEIDGRSINIGASIGLASCTTSEVELFEFLRRADIAMYDAKKNGRNRWSIFNSQLDEIRNMDLEIVQEMRNIIERDQMDIAYQPFVCSMSNVVVGVEALARWPRNSKQSLTPDKFIKLAEQHGLIDTLGMKILEKALTDLANWHELKVAVNFSPLQFQRPDLVSQIVAIANKSKFDLRRLEVELTESVLVQNSERVQKHIRDLQSYGIVVALDDFGTGYASVGYLQKFSFDKVKLDRSLTQSLSKGDQTRNIVHGTVLIAKGLSADVVAEGVETEHDANLMRLAGCKLLQGYYFGKPQNMASLKQTLIEAEGKRIPVSA
jgi:diguanylate cyclase (GGDEF)-like protein